MIIMFRKPNITTKKQQIVHVNSASVRHRKRILVLTLGSSDCANSFWNWWFVVAQELVSFRSCASKNSKHPCGSYLTHIPLQPTLRASSTSVGQCAKTTSTNARNCGVGPNQENMGSQHLRHLFTRAAGDATCAHFHHSGCIPGTLFLRQWRQPLSPQSDHRAPRPQNWQVAVSLSGWFF